MTCGRPTKAGTPCRRERADVGGGWFTPLTYYAPACLIHSTAAERQMHETMLHVIGTEERRLKAEFHQSLPVECWSWPVTSEHLALARAVRECQGPAATWAQGMTLLHIWQQGRCAICGGRCGKLFNDHSHESGLVRGKLCQSCNLSEGMAGIPGDRSARYRNRHPAVILGITIRYNSPFGDSGTVGEGLRSNLDRSPGYQVAAYLAKEDDDG